MVERTGPGRRPAAHHDRWMDRVTSVKISSLADCPHLAPVIAQWHCGEWGHLYPGGTVDGWLRHIRTRMNADRIPITVVALDGAREPVGTAALTEHDMETHRELSPWLGGVYVIPPARRRGVASALVRDLMGRAADFGIRTLHLYTNGAEGLYQKLDWRVLSREPYMGREVTIMTSTPSTRRLEQQVGFAAGEIHDPSGRQTRIKPVSHRADPDRWALLRSGEACVICRQGAPNDVLAELETSWVTVSEDALMPGLAMPEGPGPFPTILHVHGGPEFAMTEVFLPGSQSWLDHGFAFLSINYRGSTTFGRAFLEQIWGDLGRWEVEDMVAARQWLVKEGIADPARVLVTGWSYGGYLTLLAVGTTPDLWAGGMAGIAIADWAIAHEDTTDTLRGWRAARFGGTPEEQPERYATSSPITYAQHVKAPVMIIQGRNDTRTPPRSVEVYEAKMKALGKTIEVHWFDAGHGSLVVDQAIEHHELMLSFAHRVVGASQSRMSA